ncbi:hypothetical protein AB0F96_09310 [Streptomyces sp. NPDC023998]|uniref:hypothetical protein n=1 Tax=Streptomyces sp. NPDC023998 TaxID=3154597 RepID=UPI0033E01784
MDHDQTETFKTRFVLSAADRTWVRDVDLPFAPFPGLGVRIDTYEVLNIVTVTVDDPDGSVTCVVEFDDQENTVTTASRIESFGFAEGDPATPRAKNAASPVRVSLITFAKDAQWSKECDLPFPPFAGLCIRVGRDRLLKIFTIAAGKDRGDEVECYAGFEGVDSDSITEDECGTLGLARDHR